MRSFVLTCGVCFGCSVWEYFTLDKSGAVFTTFYCNFEFVFLHGQRRDGNAAFAMEIYHYLAERSTLLYLPLRKVVFTGRRLVHTNAYDDARCAYRRGGELAFPFKTRQIPRARDCENYVDSPLVYPRIHRGDGENYERAKGSRRRL